MKKFLFGLAMLSVAALSLSPAHAEVTTGDVNMRLGPGTRHGIVAVVPKGSAVAVLGCATGRTWCQVRWRRKVGWVSSRYIGAGQLPGVNMALPRASGPVLTVEMGVRYDPFADFRRDQNRPGPWQGSRERPWPMGPDRQWRNLGQEVWRIIVVPGQ